MLGLSVNDAYPVLAAGLSPARFPKACWAGGRRALSLVLTSLVLRRTGWMSQKDGLKQLEIQTSVPGVV